MMNFWQSEMGEVTGRPEHSFARTFKQIPDGTMALAKINAFVNTTYKDNKTKQPVPCLEIEWLLTDGDFQGQKVKQKIKCFDKDPNSRHRALNMLKLLYQLFGVQPQGSDAPSDQALVSFLGKTAGICIRETEPTPDGKQFNWVGEVHSPNGFVCATGFKLEVIRKPTTYGNAEPYHNSALDAPIADDDVPF